MLTGPPQTLVSKFKISFNLGLNILTSGEAGETIAQFAKRSMMNIDINNEIREYESEKAELTDLLSKKETGMRQLRTPLAVMQEYNDKATLATRSNNKRRKCLRRELSTIEAEHKTLEKDLERLKDVEDTKSAIEVNQRSKCNAESYVTRAVERMTVFLHSQGFLQMSNSIPQVTRLGAIASQFREIHPLVASQLMLETANFAELEPSDLVALFSCFTNVSVADEQKQYYPLAIPGHERLSAVTAKMGTLLDQYRDLEDEKGIDSGESYEYHYDLQAYVLDWCSAQDEIESRAVIDRLKQESGTLSWRIS